MYLKERFPRDPILVLSTSNPRDRDFRGFGFHPAACPHPGGYRVVVELEGEVERREALVCVLCGYALMGAWK